MSRSVCSPDPSCIEKIDHKNRSAWRLAVRATRSYAVEMTLSTLLALAVLYWLLPELSRLYPELGEPRFSFKELIFLGIPLALCLISPVFLHNFKLASKKY